MSEVEGMRGIGILGGMCPESTHVYAKTINNIVSAATPGQNTARMLVNYLNMATIEGFQLEGDYEGAGHYMFQEAGPLVLAGMEGILIATNTMHKSAPVVEKLLANSMRVGDKAPRLLHIADPVAAEIQRLGLTKVALFGTKVTMEDGFYQRDLKDRLPEDYELEIITPDESCRDFVHNAIFNEYMKRRFEANTKRKMLGLIDEMHEKGAQAIIQGCTELSLHVDHGDTDVVLLDTTELHSQYAAEFALANTAYALKPPVKIEQ